MGRSKRRTFKFTTPGADSNSIQGVPCDLTFTYKRPWLAEAYSLDDVKKVTVVVGEPLILDMTNPFAEAPASNDFLE